MTRPTKRQLEKELDGLTDDTSGEAPLMVLLTSFNHATEGGMATRDESPHPELTVQAWPDSDRHDELHIAVPNVWPNGYPDVGVLMVHACGSVTDTWPGESLEGENSVLACELWEKLDDDDLRREYDIRQENGDPIPPILETYA